MNNFSNTTAKGITEDVTTSPHLNEVFSNQEVQSEVPISTDNIVPHDNQSATILRIEQIENREIMNDITTILNDVIDCKVFNTPLAKPKGKLDATKVILKADGGYKNIKKGLRMIYDCICGKQFVRKNSLKVHQASHNSSRNIICQYCNKYLASVNQLRIHKEKECRKSGNVTKCYRDDTTVWKCMKCNQVFATLNSANRHTQTCVEEENKNYVVTEIIEDNTTKDNLVEQNSALPNLEKMQTKLLLQCEFCNRTYANSDFLLIHQEKHTTKVNYTCVICKKAFKSYDTAVKHWMTKCSNEANRFYLPKMTYCEYCERTFKSHETLYTHKIKMKHYTPKLHVTKNDVMHSNQSVDSIDNKNKLLKNKEAANQGDRENWNKDAISGKNKKTKQDQSHDLENQDPEEKTQSCKRKWSKQGSKAKRLIASQKIYKYQCEHCILVFDDIAELEMHRVEDHLPNFFCEECGKVVRSAEALVTHRRAHKNKKPYACQQCGRGFTRNDKLWQHMCIHQGIKPYACPHEGCEARYVIFRYLSEHICKVHTKERPFKCTLCSKSFMTSGNYRQHRLFHSKRRRHGCEICGKRFVLRGDLTKHRLIHTIERPYSCEFCGKQFRWKTNRERHMRAKHSK